MVSLNEAEQQEEGYPYYFGVTQEATRSFVLQAVLIGIKLLESWSVPF